MLYAITNKAKGDRMVLTATGGATVIKGQTSVFDLEENELKAAQPYFDNGDLEYRKATEDDLTAAGMAPVVSLNATPSSDAARAVGENTMPTNTPVDENKFGAEETVDDRDKDVTHVQHRGFGRWFGMKGDEPVTEAMNRAEAEAFAQEHKVPMGAEPDPAAGDTNATDEAPPPTETPPPDETE
jgi:hypothetical protein